MFCEIFWNLFRVRGMARFCPIYMDKAHRQRQGTLAFFCMKTARRPPSTWPGAV